MRDYLRVQVYKAHLVEGRAPAGPAVDSARANLAATFVNAFVNAGFGADKLLTPEAVGALSKLHACAIWLHGRQRLLILRNAARVKGQTCCVQ